MGHYFITVIIIDQKKQTRKLKGRFSNRKAPVVLGSLGLKKTYSSIWGRKRFDIRKTSMIK